MSRKSSFILLHIVLFIVVVICPTTFATQYNISSIRSLSQENLKSAVVRSKHSETANFKHRLTYQNRQTVCKDSKIPKGYVITAQRSRASCGGVFPNAWVIEQAGMRVTVCNISPIPEGYVIIGKGANASCPGIFPNTLTIKYR